MGAGPHEDSHAPGALPPAAARHQARATSFVGATHASPSIHSNPPAGCGRYLAVARMSACEIREQPSHIPGCRKRSSGLRTQLPEQNERCQSDADDCRAQRCELPAIEVAQRRQRLIRLDTHDLYPPNHELRHPEARASISERASKDARLTAQPFAADVFELGQST